MRHRLLNDVGQSRSRWFKICERKIERIGKVRLGDAAIIGHVVKYGYSWSIRVKHGSPCFLSGVVQVNRIFSLRLRLSLHVQPPPKFTNIQLVLLDGPE